MPAFNTLNGKFRQRIADEAAASGTDLIFTLVLSMDSAADADLLGRFPAPYDAVGAVAVVEPLAGLETSLARNRTEHRLTEKRSKRDLDWSDANVREI